MNTLMAVQNYYKVLGLDPKATNSEIKTSYHKLARLYHPDLHKGNRYHNMFIAINQAYSVLRDETSRKAYDYLLREQEEANMPKLTYGGFNPSSTPVQTTETTQTKPTEVKQVSHPKVYNLKEFNMHFDLAKTAFDQKAYVDAMNEINAALNMNPKSFMAHELKGDIFVIYKNFSEALKEFETSFKYNKKSQELQEKIEMCQEKLKPKKKTFLSKLKKKLFEDPDAL